MGVRELGPERVLFGSDFPGRSFASQLAKVYSADLSPDVRRMILGGNLKRLLTPGPARTLGAFGKIGRLAPGGLICYAARG
jgi:predicted TIM-barrel fold metal-dependent hydrolase